MKREKKYLNQPSSVLPPVPEYKVRLQHYSHKLAIWNNDKSIQLDVAELSDIENIIRLTEPGYTVMKWCNHCVGQMLDKAYKLIQ